MIDAFSQVAGVECIPARRLIGVDGTSGLHAILNSGNRFGFCPEYERQCLAVPFPHNSHDTRLPGLILGQPSVTPVLVVIRGSDVSSEVRAVNLDFATYRAVLF